MSAYKVRNKYFWNRRTAKAVAARDKRTVEEVNITPSTHFPSENVAKAALGADGYRIVKETRSGSGGKQYTVTYLEFYRKVGDYEATARCRRVTRKGGKGYFIACDSDHMKFGGDK